MSDNKKPGTALVPVAIEPIDKALVPRLGYDTLALVEEERRDAMRAFMRSSGITIGGMGLGIIGIILIASVPITSPLHLIAALLVACGIGGSVGGSMMSLLNFMRLAHAGRLRALPPDADAGLVRLEGAAHALIDAWNGRAATWSEGWTLLEQEERDLFALADRCTSEKSRGGLIRRIELVRKEKSKHLRVRAKLEIERDRILRGIDALRKSLPPPAEPLLLKDRNPDDG